MPLGLTIQSRSHSYTVEGFPSLGAALETISQPERAHYLVDRNLMELYPSELASVLPETRTVVLDATEEQKSYDAIAPVFLQFIEKGLKRDGNLVVVGGGVMQDIGCFIATTLARGIHWELIPTTLLSQADSCIGSKSSINIGAFKNQIGSFYAPHRVLMAHAVLGTLPWDQIRSGMGEILKLALLTSPSEFQELSSDLAGFAGETPMIEKWVSRALGIKKKFIEEDEFDRGRRNLLNYGHTFGHAFESATQYGIPHGIAVSLGMLAATFTSASMGMVSWEHYHGVKEKLVPWFTPYHRMLSRASGEVILQAMLHDKKNSSAGVTCILTRGFGTMEKRPLDAEKELKPCLDAFLSSELANI